MRTRRLGLGITLRRSAAPKTSSRKGSQRRRRPRLQLRAPLKETVGPSPTPTVASPVPANALAPVPPPPQESRLTVADLVRPDDRLRASIEAFLLDQRSEHTRRAYGRDLKRFVEFLVTIAPALRLHQIDRSQIIQFKDAMLAEGLEHTTVDRRLACLRSFFGWLVDDGLIQKNPAEGVRFLNPKRLSSTQGFTDEEVRRVLQVHNLHTRTGSLHRAILMVLFYCGLRRSELCSLLARNIDTERGFNVLRLRGKGNAERLMVLPERVMEALAHYFRITGRDWQSARDRGEPLFVRLKGATREELRPLDPSMVFYIVTRAAKLAGVERRVSPHSCRATAISNARDHHVPDRAIQEFAGWATPDMITRYDKRKSTLESSATQAIDYGE